MRFQGSLLENQHSDVVFPRLGVELF